MGLGAADEVERKYQTRILELQSKITALAREHGPLSTLASAHEKKAGATLQVATDAIASVVKGQPETPVTRSI